MVVTTEIRRRRKNYYDEKDDEYDDDVDENEEYIPPCSRWGWASYPAQSPVGMVVLQYFEYLIFDVSLAIFHIFEIFEMLVLQYMTYLKCSIGIFDSCIVNQFCFSLWYLLNDWMHCWSNLIKCKTAQISISLKVVYIKSFSSTWSVG